MGYVLIFAKDGDFHTPVLRASGSRRIVSDRMIFPIPDRTELNRVQIGVQQQNFHELQRTGDTEIPVGGILAIGDWDIIRVALYQYFIIRKLLQHGGNGFGQLTGFILNYSLSG
ncbi:hypothetical protein D3C81_1687010 [compost metagenome]